ncbi:hypothetical protein GOD93_11085 [Sinorhizobium medicae]|nr:hypothetical protein [Sinorhizobium medicae]
MRPLTLTLTEEADKLSSPSLANDSKEEWSWLDRACSDWSELFIDKDSSGYSAGHPPILNADLYYTVHPSDFMIGWEVAAISSKLATDVPANDIGTWSTPTLSDDSSTLGRVYHLDQLRRAKRLHAEIDGFAGRKNDWDGDDGIAPTAATLSDARAFLNFLARAGCVPQSTYSPGDGEINFEWRASKRFTEVGFVGDGSVSWYHRDASGEIFRDEPFDQCDIRKNAELLKILGVEDEGN